jgi:hypothetical protein
MKGKSRWARPLFNNEYWNNKEGSSEESNITTQD